MTETPKLTDCKNKHCQMVADMVGTLETTLLQWRERAVKAEAALCSSAPTPRTETTDD